MSVIDPFHNRVLDTEELEVLQGIFDRVWHFAEPEIDPAKREHVQRLIAVSLVNLAKMGVADPVVLEAFASRRAEAEMTAARR